MDPFCLDISSGYDTSSDEDPLKYGERIEPDYEEYAYSMANSMTLRGFRFLFDENVF